MSDGDKLDEVILCACGCGMVWSNPHWTCPECGRAEVSE